MTHYKIGDRAWLPFAETREITMTCPVCAGTKVVTLTLGSGDTATLPCDFCGKGFEGPQGYIKEWQYVSGAEELAVTQIDAHETTKGVEIEYHFGSRYAREDGIFSTRQEAEAASQKIVEAAERKEAMRAKHIKAHQAQNYSWNAGYHMREAAKAEKKAAYHREKAIICKARAKEGTK